MTTAMATRRTQVGPPPENRIYETSSNAGFLAWEKAWADHFGARVEDEGIDAEREPGGHADPYAGDPERKRRFAEAVDWIANYTGRWGFILDLRADRRFGTKHYRLSDRQVEVVLNSKARDLAAKKERVQTGRDLHCLPFGRTYAAVENDSGVLTFLIIDRCADLDRYKNPSKWAGWVFVKQFIGGVGEGQRLGSQRPGESYSGQWANLIDRVLADPMAAVRRFGTELGICGICNLPLTNEASRERGIGPVCESKLEGGL